MEILDSGSALIRVRELSNFRSMGTQYDYGLMCLLKEARAPIIGCFDPRPDTENYKWEMKMDTADAGVINGIRCVDSAIRYTWKKKTIKEFLDEH